MTDNPTLFYLVISDEGLEGSFQVEADAVGYLNELKEIGVTKLRITTHLVGVSDRLTVDYHIRY